MKRGTIDPLALAETSERVDGTCDHLSNRCLVRHISLMCDGGGSLAAQLRRDGLSSFDVKVHNEHARARLAQCVGKCTSNALTGPCHERNLTVQSQPLEYRLATNTIHHRISIESLSDGSGWAKC